MKDGLVAKALRGFFILLPFLIAYLMVGQLVDMLLALTQPLIDVMPGIVFKTEGSRRLVAFGVLIVVCVLVAQVAHTRLARSFGRFGSSGRTENHRNGAGTAGEGSRPASARFQARLRSSLQSHSKGQTRGLLANGRDGRSCGC